MPADRQSGSSAKKEGNIPKKKTASAKKPYAKPIQAKKDKVCTCSASVEEKQAKPETEEQDGPPTIPIHLIRTLTLTHLIVANEDDKEKRYEAVMGPLIDQSRHFQFRSDLGPPYTVDEMERVRNILKEAGKGAWNQELKWGLDLAENRYENTDEEATVGEKVDMDE